MKNLPVLRYCILSFNTDYLIPLTICLNWYTKIFLKIKNTQSNCCIRFAFMPFYFELVSKEIRSSILTSSQPFEIYYKYRLYVKIKCVVTSCLSVCKSWNSSSIERKWRLADRHKLIRAGYAIFSKLRTILCIICLHCQFLIIVFYLVCNKVSKKKMLLRWQLSQWICIVIFPFSLH